MITVNGDIMVRQGARVMITVNGDIMVRLK